MDSLQGHLLVASPELRDPNFFRAVVLLIQHNDQGAMGLVLNRPTGTPIGEVWKQVRDTPCCRETPLCLGGPCQGPLMALIADPRPGDVEVLPGVAFTADAEKLEELVAEDRPPARFFAGFAGWAPGQLEDELKQGSWQTVEAAAAHVFDEAADLWTAVRKQIADAMLVSALHIRHVPADPRLN